MLKSEIHLVLIWEKGLEKLSHIMYDLKNSFKIIDVKRVVWGSDNFSNNLSRFYGQKLPNKSFKEKHCGKGPFITVVIEQENPVYEKRKTSKGEFLVNSLLYDKKQLYRKWTGGGHKIHTSNDEVEADHDLFFLFNKKPSDYLNHNSWDNKIEDYKIDIRGVDNWKNFDDLFCFINQSSEYVVLRNYEYIDTLDADKSDIDFLTIDENFAYHINGSKKHKNKSRSAYTIKIKNKYYSVDVRCFGDGYYDAKWVKDIIKKRIFYKDRFFIPCPEDEFFSLLYHSLIHKNRRSDKYFKKLVSLVKDNSLKCDIRLLETREGAFEVLKEYMDKNGYEIISPEDYSVQFNYKNKGLKRYFWEFVGRFKNAK